MHTTGQEFCHIIKTCYVILFPLLLLTTNISNSVSMTLSYYFSLFFQILFMLWRVNSRRHGRDRSRMVRGMRGSFAPRHSSYRITLVPCAPYGCHKYNNGQLGIIAVLDPQSPHTSGSNLTRVTEMSIIHYTPRLFDRTLMSFWKDK